MVTNYTVVHLFMEYYSVMIHKIAWIGKKKSESLYMWLLKTNQRNIYKIFETLNYPFISPNVHLEKSYKISKTPQDSDEMVMERK